MKKVLFILILFILSMNIFSQDESVYFLEIDQIHFEGKMNDLNYYDKYIRLSTAVDDYNITFAQYDIENIDNSSLISKIFKCFKFKNRPLEVEGIKINDKIIFELLKNEWDGKEGFFYYYKNSKNRCFPVSTTKKNDSIITYEVTKDFSPTNYGNISKINILSLKDKITIYGSPYLLSMSLAFEKADSILEKMKNNNSEIQELIIKKELEYIIKIIDIEIEDHKKEIKELNTKMTGYENAIKDGLIADDRKNEVNEVISEIKLYIDDFEAIIKKAELKKAMIRKNMDILNKKIDEIIKKQHETTEVIIKQEYEKTEEMILYKQYK